MNNQEFSSGFDVLYNNIASNDAPSVSEYEKSLFLTKAQLQLISVYFTGQETEGFDANHRRQYDFSNLIKVGELISVNPYGNTITKLDRRSKVFLYPKDYFLAVNEIISDNIRQYSVLPINAEEYRRLMLKPYGFPNKREVWRMFTNPKLCNYYNNDGYSFLSTWGGNPLELNITTAVSETSLVEEETKSIYTADDYILVKIDNEWYRVEVVLSNVVSVNLISDKDTTLLDDATTIQVLKKCFAEYRKLEPVESTFNAITIMTDGFQTASAPEGNTEFQSSKTILTTLVEITAAEILGKFQGELSYRLRYVKKPTPIILEDLGEDAIEGISKATECTLPEILHHEILDRAVLLAKLAWQGTQVPNAQTKQ